MRSEVAAALDELGDIASTLPVFRKLRSAAVRRVHLQRVHRHLYLALNEDRVVVLAVWGAVRAILPALRARIASIQSEGSVG